MMDYLKLTFSDVDQSQQEIIIAQLSEYDFIGFEQKEKYLLAYTEYHTKAYKEYEAQIENMVYSEEIIPEVNWNEQWERDFEPIIIAKEVAIRAHFHQPITVVKQQIIITPKMSFGTGHHATTQLMLRQMSGLDLQGKKIFDYGTGTGVLGIYASMLGADEIIANDIDPWSQENAEENVKRNGVSNMDIRLGGIEAVAERGFDCILANINLNVLKESMKELFFKLKKDSLGLILSGVLKGNQKDIQNEIELYSADYHVFELNGWLCIHAKY